MIVYCNMLLISMLYSFLFARNRDTVILHKKSKNLDILFFGLSLLPLFYVSAFRYSVGCDYFFYIDKFNAINNLGIKTHFEPGFLLLNVLIYKLGLGYQWIFIICAFVTILCLGQAIKISGSNYTLGLFLFVTMGFFLYSLNNPRYYVAVAMALLAGVLFNNKHYIRSIVLILIGCLIHKSILVVALVFLFSKLKLSRNLYILIGLLGGLCIPFSNQIRRILFMFYSFYENSRYDVRKLSIYNVLLSSLVLLAGIILYKKLKSRDIFYFNISFLATIYYICFSWWIPEASRIGIYMVIFYVIYIPILLSYISTEKTRNIITLIVAMGYIAYFYIILHTNHNNGLPYFLPYHFINPIIKWVFAVMSIALYLSFCYFYKTKKLKEQINYIGEIKKSEIQPMISVIVPIYKVEKYLKRCVDSIINQDYKNLEIILVDDGSPDNCPKICEEYAKKDTRIKVVHKENGGLSDARNAGIEVVSGEYIAFIDSDDYINESYISSLLYTMEKYDADISACNYFKVYEDSGIEEIESKTDQDLVMNNIEAMKDLFTLPNNSDVVAWNKLYKTSLFTQNDIRFPKGKLHEDSFTTYKLYYYSNKVTFTNVPFYYYLQRNDSITGEKFSIRRLEDTLSALEETKAFVENHNIIDLKQELEFNEWVRLLSILNFMVDKNRIDKKIFEDVRTMIKNREEVYLSNTYFSIKHKMAFYLIKAGMPIYYLVRKIFCYF